MVEKSEIHHELAGMIPDKLYIEPTMEFHKSIIQFHRI